MKINVKISNWNDVPEINGIMFDRHDFPNDAEIANAKDWSAHGYACKCGTTFLSKYGVCPNCGNRDFSQKDFWDVVILKDTCLIMLYKYYMKKQGDDYVIVKTSGEFRDFTDVRIDYKDVYAKHPELLDIPKYKYLYDLALYIDHEAELSTWWIVNRIGKLVFEETGKYDLDISKKIVDMFEYQSQLSSFINSSDAIRVVAFVQNKKYNPELIKRVNIRDFMYEYAKIDALPTDFINAALNGGCRDLLSCLLVAFDILQKYDSSEKCISALVYYLSNINFRDDCRKRMETFVEWTMKTNGEATMKNFYWDMNMHYIQKSGINENSKKILSTFDEDPINTIIKLAK